jgi:hypothetical protein
MSQYFTPEAVVCGVPETLLGVAAGVADGLAAAGVDVACAAGLAAEFAGFFACAASNALAVRSVKTKADCRICTPLTGFV